MKHRFTLAVLAFACIASVRAADAPPVHGVADAFAQSGVALAWGVLRGRTDGETVVVVRVKASSPTYAFVAADGVDPFTQQRKSVAAPVSARDGVDLRFPRAQFADFPRTEFKFSTDGKEAPSLVVYYLGVPDTTPEFPNGDALRAYLDDRLSRARDGGAAPK